MRPPFDSDHNQVADTLSRLLIAGGEVLMRWDLATGRLDWSDNAATVLSLEPADLPQQAQDLVQRLAPDDVPARAVALDRHLHGDEPYQCQYKLRRSDGRFDWIDEQAVVEHDEDGQPRVVWARLQSVTEERQRLEELERLAHLDPLTGYLNRPRLSHLLSDQLARAFREQTRFGYMIVNIDRLGLLNNAYGFDIADEVIRQIGSRIERLIGSDDVISRVGGNQFGLLLHDSDRDRIRDTSEVILASVREDVVRTSAGPLQASVTLGGTILPETARDERDAIGQAEEALAKAKRDGRDRFICYRPSASRDAARRRSLATGDHLLAALRENRIKFAVQPIVDSRDQKPELYECLLRMLDENGDIVPAGLLMPAAEELGLIRQLDRHILEQVLGELSRTQDIHLAVNVSGLTATDPVMLGHLFSMVHANADVADRLTFEITETVAMLDFEETARFVTKLRDLGCRIAIDDFGAGYTSFRHLKKLDVDVVKIDGQFVQGLQNNRENQLFVRTLTELAKGFDMGVVAECVEHDVEAAALRALGVDYLQGYLYGAPTLERPWAQATKPARPSLVQVRGRRLSSSLSD